MRLPAEPKLYTFLSIILTFLGVVMLAPILREQVLGSLIEGLGGRTVGQSSFAPLGWISLGVLAFGLLGLHIAQRLSQQFRE